MASQALQIKRCFWAAAFVLAGCSSSPPAEDAGKVAQNFLDAVRSGRVDDAWESTTPEFKSAEGREAFRRSVKKQKVFKTPLKQSSQESVSIGSLSRLQIVYQSEDSSLKAFVKLLLADDKGVWKVDSINVE